MSIGKCIKIPQWMYHTLALALWLFVVNWSTFAILKYHDEPLTTQSQLINVDTRKEFPTLTLCPEDPNYYMRFIFWSYKPYFHVSLYKALDKNVSLVDLQEINQTMFYDILPKIARVVTLQLS